MSDQPRKQIKYDVPAGATVAKCRGCDADIVWLRTEAGKLMPIDGDGTPHFATCPKAAQFRRKL